MPLKRVAATPATSHPDAIRMKDARGLDYELLTDLPKRPGMRTAAAAIASRLFHVLGYRAAEVWLITTAQHKRVAATRWPVGTDLGPTPIRSTRDDDPNDVLPHVERRSLRALKLFTAWLGMTRLRPRTLWLTVLGSTT